MLANVLLVARILGVYAYGSIAHYGFGACGGDGQEVIASFDIVTQIVELAVLFSVDNLFVRKGCLRLRVPIDDTYPTIDKSTLVEVTEYLYNGARAVFV